MLSHHFMWRASQGNPMIAEPPSRVSEESCPTFVFTLSPNSYGKGIYLSKKSLMTALQASTLAALKF